MAKSDKGQREPWEDYPPNDPKTEAALRRWDAQRELADKVRDWLGR